MSTEFTSPTKSGGKEDCVYEQETVFASEEKDEAEVRGDGAVSESEPHAELQSLHNLVPECHYEEEINTTCGYKSCRPAWLQKFARAEVYAVVHGLIGFFLTANNNYNIGTLTTLEKHLKIPSKLTGFIRSSFEIGSIGTLPFMGYAARHVHPMYLLSGGIMVVCASCLCFSLPHIIFGAGPEAIALASAAAITNLSSSTSGEYIDILCGGVKEEHCADDGSGGYSSTVSSVILFIANVLLGIGNSAHFSVGIAYLDNNSRKNIAPVLLAITACIQMLGPSLGFSLSAFALSHYVDPALEPTFTKDDPRWIGAWWMGWPLLASFSVTMAAVALLFPRSLPLAEQRRRQQQKEGGAPAIPERPSFKDFKLTMKRLFGNKVLMFNILSGVCLGFGFEFYLIYMPKYIETQFHKSASHANLITGSIGMTMTGLGLVTAALFIVRFKPRPRTIAAWNVLTEAIAVVGHLCWAFIGCPSRDLHGSLAPDGSWNLTSSCNVQCGCGPEVQYAPICSMNGYTTFFSPCHGGCSDLHIFQNGTKMFSDCDCIAGGVATDGPCAIDCSTSFTLFIATQCIIHFLEATGRAGNILLTFRSVDDKDKSLTIALGELSLCILAFFPAPTVYGTMLDLACLVWGVSCGESGNCWFYDDKSMRYMLNFTAAGLLLIGVVFDVAVWVYCRELKVYDEDDKQTSNGGQNGGGKKGKPKYVQDSS